MLDPPLRIWNKFTVTSYVNFHLLFTFLDKLTKELRYAIPILFLNKAHAMLKMNRQTFQNRKFDVKCQLFLAQHKGSANTICFVSKQVTMILFFKILI